MICKPKFYFVNDFSSEDMDLCPSFLVLINRKQAEEFTMAHLTITDVIYEKVNKKVSCQNIHKCRDGAASH